MRDTCAELERWLASGGEIVGQVRISRSEAGWELRHVEDAGRSDLETFTTGVQARSLANLDDAGVYRPLKTAPNLRRGWRLVLANVAEVRKAVEGFYPGMLGLWLARRAGEVEAVPLRETLARQTGMYRVTQKITDEHAQEMIGRVCHPGCIKTILWQLAPGLPIATLPPEKFLAPAEGALPLWCQEACNILVAEARKVVKAAAPPPPPTA
jgi:sirohydrochlorin cobaltochelatase